MDKFKILIVEDEKKIARFLELELEHEGYLVEAVHDGRTGLSRVKEQEYDLVLLDIMLPELDGIELCRRIRQFSSLPVIMLTAKDDVSDKVTGLDIGADDYVTKPFVIEEVLARIRALIRRSQEQPDSQRDSANKLQLGDLVMDLSGHEVTRCGQVIPLTKREFDLLEYLLRNSGIVLDRDKILAAVWGYDYEVDGKILDVYIRYLRSKIDDPFDQKLLHTVRGYGYTLKES
jgi:DNA-binding response OmpR family regulator